MQNSNYSLGDTPCRNTNEDKFNVNDRFIKNIYELIQDSTLAPITIAITGEWGIGKTTAINFLCERLLEDENKKNIVVFFEPLLEGKFEIVDMMELFYLKLYQNINGKEELKKFIKKALVSLALISRCKISGNVNLPGIAEAKINYDWGKNVDEILRLWETHKPKEFSENLEQLNGVLKKKEYKLFVIIDEVDRLSANYIINILLFCRILESFQGLFCIVGIDYQQILNKLCKENFVNSVEIAQSYLDKLFQVKFHLHHSKEVKADYSKKILQQIDINNTFINIVNSESSISTNEELFKIIDYLFTPRQIKKWLLSIKINYVFIEHCPNPLALLKILAVIVKYPIIQERLALEAQTLNIVLKNPSSDKAGIKKILEETEPYQKDEKTWDFIIDFFEQTPSYLITFFFEGFIQKEHLSLYKNFFDNDINKAIEELLNEGKAFDHYANDISDTLIKNKLIVKNTPSLELLNKLWLKKSEWDSLYPYGILILYLLEKHPLEKVIEKCVLTLSEVYLRNILTVCNIRNINKYYNLNSFVLPDDRTLLSEGLLSLNFNGQNIKSFNTPTLNSILMLWIKKVESELQNKESTFFSEKKLLTVFYRFVQFGYATSGTFENRQKLATYLVNFLKSEIVSQNDKRKLLDELAVECVQYFQKNMDPNFQNPVEALFDYNKEFIIEAIKSIDEVGNIKAKDAFISAVGTSWKED